MSESAGPPDQEANAVDRVCDRCGLASPGDRCVWCGHVHEHPAAAEAVQAAHREQLVLRREGPARRRWRAENDHPAFMTCPACGRWSRFGLCEWCDFNATDQVAVDAHETHRRHGKEYRTSRRRGDNRRGHLYEMVRGLVRFDLEEQGRLIAHLVRWVGLGAVVGVLAGLSSAGFLATLNWVTDYRIAHPLMLWLLPVAGFAVGLAYHYGGGDAAAGNNLIIDEIHEPKAWIPRRMAPLVYLGTEVTHLFGGSAGREGTALQMSGSLTDWFSRTVHLKAEDRRIMLIAALAGGFGAVFGVPVAGFVFGLEVQSIGRMRYDALVPAITASLIGDLIVRGLGVHHTEMPAIANVDLSAGLVGKVAIAGLAFGLTALFFAEITHGIRRSFSAASVWPPLRPFFGGIAVVAMTYLVGNYDYNGLSVPLITASVAGGIGVVAFAFAWKFIFTAVTLGSGFQGGEVTPLFVIGATLGVTLGRLLGVDPQLMAAIGLVAVFAGAANVPIACTVMGAELFGADAFVLFAVACVVSYVFSSHRGIYTSQRIGMPKAADLPGADTSDGTMTLHTIGRGRQLWLPDRRRAGRGDDAGDDEEAS